MVKQMAENTTAEQSDWLIGEGCLMPDVKGVALRNMKAPGTAYNDPDKLVRLSLYAGYSHSSVYSNCVISCWKSIPFTVTIKAPPQVGYPETCYFD